MFNELLALRALEREIRSSLTTKEKSSDDNVFVAALDAIRIARQKDEADVDPDFYGEMLRNGFFDGEGYGCYSTFDLTPDFAEVDKTSSLGKAALHCLFSDYSWYAEPESDEYASEISRAHVWATKTHFAAWYWDGDGTLVVGDLNENGKIVRAATNSDCKKAYGWVWIPVQA